MLNDRAAELLEFFEFDLTERGMTVTLAENAPDSLRDLAQSACGDISPEALAVLFEALSTVANAEDPRLTEIDEKVCPLSTFRRVLAFLEQA